MNARYYRCTGLLQFGVIVAALALAGTKAGAQQRSDLQRQDNDSALPLPYGIDRLIAIDDHNDLIAELSPDEDGGDENRYRGLSINHIYAGGIARLFGGSIVPAGTLVSPVFNGGGNGGQWNGGRQNGAPQTFGALNGPAFSSPGNGMNNDDQAFNNFIPQGFNRR